MTRPAVTLLGARVTGRCTTRRGTAAAGPIPASTMRRPCRSALSQGHLPASSRPAVSTRVHQCGGSPIHNALARRADPRAQIGRAHVELQSRRDLVCRLLLEKKKKKKKKQIHTKKKKKQNKTKKYKT